MIRYVYFANNRVAHEVAAWLASRGERPVAVVVHPDASARCRDEIVDAAGVPPNCVFEGPSLREPATLEALRQLRPDAGLSVLFDYILRPELLSLFPRGCLNLHPSLLPFNKGQYPNVWSIVERTPAGATLHYLDEGIDTGDVIAQQEVPVLASDTGETLYRRLEDACVSVFKETWPAWLEGRAPRTSQPAGGTLHRTRDVERIDAIDLDATYRAGDLIDILRARTFPPYRGAYFMNGGRKVYVRVSLEEES